ncbi:MAG: guanylate kinase [Firmicutes bacterium]|nr:guanylate kinase [Bacillota bacterium]
MTDAGLLFVLSGPSGVGKGTVGRALRKRLPQLAYSVSVTTRPPRPGERDGVDYFFVAPPRFQEMIAQGEVLEWAEVYGHWYGTPRAFVEKLLRSHIDILLEIDTQGAMQVKERYPDAVTLFLLPPSLKELRKRIERRGTETREAAAERFRSAQVELTLAPRYDYAIVNDRLDEAVRRCEAVVVAEHCRSRRLRFPQYAAEINREEDIR